MPRGRPPKPTLIRLLEGDRRKHAAGPQRAPVKARGAAFVPHDLPLAAQAAMREILDAAPPGMFAVCDTPQLVAFSMCAAIMQKANAELWASGGPIVDGKRNPWLRILNRESSMMARLGAGLGLNPVDRARLMRWEPVGHGRRKLANMREGNPDGR
jgi:phage terminase small subunit